MGQRTSNEVFKDGMLLRSSKNFQSFSFLACFFSLEDNEGRTVLIL